MNDRYFNDCLVKEILFSFCYTKLLVNYLSTKTWSLFLKEGQIIGNFVSMKNIMEATVQCTFYHAVYKSIFFIFFQAHVLPMPT